MKQLTNPPIIYIIIVTYNGAKWIKKCIDSLIDPIIPHKILVVDNSSTDGTLDLINGNYPEVEIIPADINLGFGKANNLGIQRALMKNADYVFLLNQDAWIESDTIEKLLSVSKKNSNIGIISPIHLNGSGNGIDTKFQDYLNRNNTPHFLSDLYLNDLKPFYETKFVNAAAWLIPTRCIAMVGMFDPIFPHYGEDDDFCRRLRKSGYTIGIVPNARIFHDRPQEGEVKVTYNKNKLFKDALLEMRKNPLKKHFIIRKLIVMYFELYIVFFGHNDALKQEIKKLKLKLSFDKSALVYEKKLINENTKYE